jgi:hypothetical protein
MSATIASFDEPTDFSLVQGGPLYQFLLRVKLETRSMGLAARRIVVISLAAWLPLLLLTVLSGNAFGGVAVPFIQDLAAHARLLVGLPLFIAAEVVVHRRIKVIVRQFLDRDIVGPEGRPQFEKIIDSAMRLRDSAVAELLILAAVITLGQRLGGGYINIDVPSWWAAPIAGELRLTVAGYWYVFVSLTIYRFLFLRWYFRLIVWYRFLWQVARRVPLKLNALHPDKAGGLGFLVGSVFAFAPVLLAVTVALAGSIGNKIWHEGAKLPEFKLETFTWLFFLTLLVLAPLFFFVTHLGAARRNGLREYGIVASRYIAEFRRKWIEGHVREGEGLLGSGDIQSLADLSNSYEVVRKMSLVPFSRTTVMHLVLLMIIPLAPLTLTMFSLEKLIERALGVLW